MVGSILQSAANRAWVTDTGSQTITTGNWTVVVFNSERSDTAGYHSTSSNTGRLTVPTGFTGTYLVSAHIAIGASAGGALRGLRIVKNGTQVLAIQSTPPNGSFPDYLSVSTWVDLTTIGDYVTCEVYQDSGGNLGLTKADYYSPEFKMYRIS
jgi:hypothetical protein